MTYIWVKMQGIIHQGKICSWKRVIVFEEKPIKRNGVASQRAVAQTVLETGK